MNIFNSLDDDSDRQERSALTSRLVEAATEASRTGELDAWEPVIDMLYRATIILPFGAEEDGDEVEDADPVPIVPIVANEEGEQLLPVFTDEEELDSWRPAGGRYTLLQTAEILKVAVDRGFTGLVINPSGDIPIELGAENIQDEPEP